MMGILYLVATPIGNLEDITLRALRVLREADFVICEDTRHSGMLLKHFEIKKPLRSFHEHTSEDKVKAIVSELASGLSAAFITDAGTPLVSDPGFELVREALRRGVRIESVPGPSACLNALALSGLSSHAFTFFGFLPQKPKKRDDVLEALASEPRTLVFYESPYRVAKTLEAMLAIFGDRDASVSREMTKKFEETVRGRLSEILAMLKNKKMQGEYTIVMAGATGKEPLSGTGGSAAPAAADRLRARRLNPPSAGPNFKRLRELPSSDSLPSQCWRVI